MTTSIHMADYVKRELGFKSPRQINELKLMSDMRKSRIRHLRKKMKRARNIAEVMVFSYSIAVFVLLLTLKS